MFQLRGGKWPEVFSLLCEAYVNVEGFLIISRIEIFFRWIILFQMDQRCVILKNTITSLFTRNESVSHIRCESTFEIFLCLSKSAYIYLLKVQLNYSNYTFLLKVQVNYLLKWNLFPSLPNSLSPLSTKTWFTYNLAKSDLYLRLVLSALSSTLNLLMCLNCFMFYRD